MRFEQVHAGIMDVAGIFLVDRHRMRAENLALHHLGEAEDGVERRAQFVAHLREEARFRDIGGFGAMPRLVGDRLGLLELADQRVLFGARFQRRQRGRVQAMGKEREVAFGRDRQRRQHVIVEAAAQQEIQRDRHRHRHGRRKGGDRQIGREHAGDRDHQQHQEHHHGVGHRRQRGMDQDRHPAEPIEQVEQHEARPPFPGRR